MNESTALPDALRRERQFFTLMTVALGVGVFVGFSRTFYLRPLFPGAEAYAAPETFFYWHGAVFTAWIALLITQAWLIRRRSVLLIWYVGIVG